MNNDLIIRGGRVLDVDAGVWEERDVVIRAGEVVPSAEASEDAEIWDAEGKYVLPGLIDCHVHVLAAPSADLGGVGEMSPNYVAMAAAQEMGRMLDRGFTTVRDIGGADFGIKEAQREGLVRGPRMFMGGKALSQTGGHGDMRGPGRNTFDPHYCCPIIARVADGVDEVRRAARDEIRRGADHIKIMVSGGVASPTDRVDSTQYSMDEIRAIVEEAEAANRYVAAHAYTSRAILRALEGGVRSIEHANLMDESVVEALGAREDAYVVMNLVTYWALQEEGRKHGLPEAMYRKTEAVLDGGVNALKLCHEAGIVPAFGSDLLGGMQRHQAREFSIRAEHVPTIDVLRSATTEAAKLLREDRLGRLSPGAFGDAVIVDVDPLEDMSVLGGSRLAAVVQGGVVC